MSDCRICAASNEGAHVLKLEGDVRLTMCTALDQYFQSMFAEPDFMSVWVDMTVTGSIAPPSACSPSWRFRPRSFDFRPAIFSTNPSIDRLLDTMGFDQLFSDVTVRNMTRQSPKFPRCPAKKVK